MAYSNPEGELIDLIVEQLEDDEAVIEGLGAGTLSLRDLERWRERRWQSERRFMKETGRVIGRMRDEGFGQEMRHGQARAERSGSRNVPYRREPQPQPRRSSSNGRRFSLELEDLGLPCTMRLAGDYDDVLDAGVFHLRHSHRVHGSEESLRETVESAIVELQRTAQAPETRYRGFRSEERPSNEWENRTRGSGFDR